MYEGTLVCWQASVIMLPLSLFHIGGVVVRQVVIATFDPDVLHLPTLVRVGNPARAQLIIKQGLHFLQPTALCLGQTAINKHESQPSKAGVQEECPYGKR